MPSNDPAIVSVVYDGAKVAVRWTPSADTGVTGYVIQLGYLGQGAGAPGYQSSSIPGRASSFGTLTLPGPLNTDVTYFCVVQAMWGSEPGEASAPVVMPTELPVVESVWYDGDQVSFAWAPTSQAARGYQLTVYSLDSGMQYVATVPSPVARAGTIPPSTITAPLDPAQQWVAVVDGMGEGGAYARSATAMFPKPLPAMQLGTATYQEGERIFAGWNPVISSSISGYRIQLTSPQDDTLERIDITSGTATNGTLPLGAALPASQRFELRVIALSSGGAGVATRAAKVITEVPPLVSVAYDGSASVAMQWAPSTNGMITGYTLQVLSLASGVNYTAQVQSYWSTSGTVTFPSPLDPAQPWVARLYANGEVSAQSPDTPIPAAIPALREVRCDGAEVTVEWGLLQPDPGSVTARLLSGSTVLASAPAGGTSASLPLPSGAATPTAQVTPRLGIATGGPSTAATVLSDAPQVTSFVTDPVSGVATLSWSAVTQATDYLLTFSNGTTATVTTLQYPFPTAPSPEAALSVAVTARAVNGSVTSIGPAGAPAALATGQPVLAHAGYNGVQASAQWAPVAHASGYRISIQTSGTTPAEVATFDAPAGATSAAFAFAPSDTTKTYVLGVQATFASTTAKSSGPMSALLPIFAPGFFPSRALTTTAYPYIYPATNLATVSAATPGEAITIYLPQIGGGAALQGLPLTQGPFTLAANSDSGTSAAYPYVLTMLADSSVWTFTAEPIRASLQADYISFLQKAEQPTGVIPWGLGLLQEAISRYMPQTFQETLYYAFGLTFPSGGGAGSAFADLRPGMVLRVAADPYQAITESSTLKWASGYIAGPVVDYDVGSFTDTAGNWTVGYDSFIGQLVAGGALAVPPPPYHAETNQEGGVADAADLYFPGFRMPFYRLFVPTNLATASAICPTDTPRSFVLAAAPTYTALNTTVNTPGGTYPVAYFRGRSVVRPCIRVFLDGTQVVVPIGTTVGNLLERAGRAVPPAPAQVSGLRVQRSLGPVVLSPGQPISAGATYPVRLDWSTQPQYAPGWTAMSLPLLAGDRVDTGGR